MKICAIICEFNPFHNGHKYLIENVKASGKYAGVLCVMSGHFTQRGDRAIFDKFTRARHAVMGGADCIIELPASFAVAPAEIFAQGAVKLASSIPDVCALSFGCEEQLDFKALARTLSDESADFKERLMRGLDMGESYAKSYARAVEDACGAKIDSPNNILGLEYAKAILKYRPDLEIMTVRRVGSGYNDTKLDGNYASASAIRAHLGEHAIYNSVPPFVARDLPNGGEDDRRWESIVRYALTTTTADGLNAVYGCGEGLANRLKSLQRLPLEQIILQATSRRYPAARIRRALTANALKLTAAETENFLNGAGYIKPLAVKAARADEMLKALSSSPYPVVVKGSDVERLQGLNARLYAASRLADDIWCAACAKDIYDCTIIKV